MARHLQVILYGQVLGTLTQSDGGQHTFTYADPNTRTPLSLSMPPATTPITTATTTRATVEVDTGPGLRRAVHAAMSAGRRRGPA